MKLVSVKISNIASLKGEHFIDFDAFQSEGASFAITGDTGAGKSTILNCVSLALYGRSYKSLTQGDFVTLGEAQGRIELVFSCSGSLYLSVWGCRVRKKNGEYLKLPTHVKDFYRLEGEQKKILSISPEEVIGLNFEQFCKTVILNQGEFARFLVSSFRERKDILEKLYEGQRLDALNPLLRQKISELAAEAEKLESQIQGLSEGLGEYVDPEKLEGLNASLAVAREEFARIQKVANALKDVNQLSQGLVDSRQRMAQLEEKLQDSAKSLNETALRRKTLQAQYDKFEVERKERAPKLHQAVESAKTLQKLKERKRRLLETKAQYQKDIAKTEEELAQARNELQVVGAGEKAAAKQIQFMFESLGLPQVAPDRAQLERIKNAAMTMRELSAKIDGAAKLQERVAEEERKLASEREKLAAATLQLEEEKNQHQLALEAAPLQQAQERLAALQRAQAKLEGAQQLRRQIMEQKLLDEAEAKEAEQKLAQLESKRQDLSARIEMQRDALKATRLEGARIVCLEESLENQACVICSNQDIAHLNLAELESSHEKILAYERNLQELEEQAAGLARDLEKERAHGAAGERALTSANERLAQAEKDYFDEHAALFKAEGFVSEGILADQTAAQWLSTQINNEQKSLAELKERQEFLFSSEQRLAMTIERLTQINQEFASNAGEAAKLAQQIKEGMRELEASREEIKNLIKLERPEDVARYLKLREDWEEARRNLEGTQTKLKHGQDMLQSRKEAQAALLSELEQLNKEEKELQSFILELSPEQNPADALEELERQKQVLEHKRAQMEEEHRVLEIEQSSLFSRKQTFAEQVSDQQNLLASSWSLLRDSIALAKEAGATRIFSSEEAPLERDQLEKTLERLGLSETPVGQDELKLAWELCSQGLELRQELLNRKQEDFTRYKTLLAAQENARERIKGLAQILDQTREHKEQWEELHMIIGKDEFRNYILAMVEKILIQQTNAELSKLCDGRYLIEHRQVSSRVAPEFFIIDKFRSDEIRKVSTLSGGETFMVSLAMALALAELTRGSADIDSFFIDEGFGSLDQDSLEEALEMLQDIETRGKQIGIISHVKELTQRIPVNVHLSKNRFGNSSIEVVYN